VTANIHGTVSRERIGHLRTVHFTLLSISLVVAVARDLLQSPRAAIAKHQLEGIAGALARWDDSAQTMDVAFDSTILATDRARSGPLPPFPEYLAVGPRGSRRRLLVGRGSRTRWHPFPGRVPYYSRTGFYSIPLKPGSLDEFRETWDSLARSPVHVVVRPIGTVTAEPNLRYVGDNRIALINNQYWQSVVRISQLGEDYSSRAEDKVDTLRSGLASGYPGEGRRWLPERSELMATDSRFPPNSPGTQFVLQVKVRPFKLDLRAVTSRVLGLGWPAEDFATNAPELSEMTRRYSWFPLEQVMAILTEEAERSGERIEVFGARLPARETAFWGCFAIVIVQLYFLIHLLALKTDAAGTLFPAHDHAWVVLYSGRLARAMSFASLFAPAAAILWLVSAKPGNSVPLQVFLAFLALSSLLMSVRSAECVGAIQSVRKPDN
jgi:hypothetical protein